MIKLGAFNPDMLLTARNYNGLSQTQVADKCGISQSLYSKIEGGATLIGSDDPVIENFSLKLGFPTSFFFKNAKALGVPPSFHEMFRKPKTVAGKKSLAQVSADLTIKMLCVSKLLNSIDIEPELMLPQYDIEDYAFDAAQIARMVRKTWMLPPGPIQNLTELVEKAGVIIYPTDFLAPKVDGVTINIAGLPPVIFLNINSPADRVRFSLAHELGHVVMHRQMSLTMEDEANAFASELLMPANEMRGEFGKTISLRELARLKRIRKVSMAALLYRAGDIGKLTKNQSAYLWRQMSKYRLDEPSSTHFEKEQPTTMRGMLKLFIETLGYSFSDLGNSFDLYEDMTRHVLAHNLPNERKLRLVIG
ncbi:MAG: XRE family transcriptional regulator [Pseudohongiellaceae bacterium]